MKKDQKWKIKYKKSRKEGGRGVKKERE